MINTKMYNYGNNRSTIRDLFEYGQNLKAKIGEVKVFDFSLGNPNVPAPTKINDSIRDLLQLPPSLLHGYTSAQGLMSARQAITDDLNNRYNSVFSPDKVYITMGAASSLCSILRSLISDKDDNIAVISPYFPEYIVFIEANGGKVNLISQADGFDINFEELQTKINSNTQAIIINSPNNPSGVIYSEKTLNRLSDLLKTKEKEFGHPIYIISDEPYRELAYDLPAPFTADYYENTIVCYSYSKSLSLAGERIGYVAIPESCAKGQELYFAICGSARTLGYVCPSSLFQRVITECIECKPNLSQYKKNRDLLYSSLTKIGFDCINPEGAFYLLVKAPDGDDKNFSEVAKKLGLLLVPGTDFGAKGYVRIAYCVSYEMIERSLPYFEELIKSYK